MIFLPTFYWWSIPWALFVIISNFLIVYLLARFFISIFTKSSKNELKKILISQTKAVLRIELSIFLTGYTQVNLKYIDLEFFFQMNSYDIKMFQVLCYFCSFLLLPLFYEVLSEDRISNLSNKLSILIYTLFSITVSYFYSIGEASKDAENLFYEITKQNMSSNIYLANTSVIAFITLLLFFINYDLDRLLNFLKKLKKTPTSDN